MTAAAWLVKANDGSYRTDGTDIPYRYAYFNFVECFAFRAIVLTKVVLRLRIKSAMRVWKAFKSVGALRWQLRQPLARFFAHH